MHLLYAIIQPRVHEPSLQSQFQWVYDFPHVPRIHHRATYSRWLVQTYVGDYVFIKSLSEHKFQAFVSSYTKGKDDWSTLGDSWGTEDGRWSRSGWEVIAIRNADDTKRVGYYEYVRGATIYITVRAIDKIEVERATDPDAPPRE